MRKIMVMDAEYNQPSKKCIAIGAAIYDLKNGMLMASMEVIINPKEPINPVIVALTGINDSYASNGVSIIEAYQQLKAFHKRHKAFRNPLLWGSGVRNDSLAIYEEYKNAVFNTDGHGIDLPDEENFMGFRVIDAKTLYQSIMLVNDQQYAGNLEDCMERLGLKFEGEPHRALTDAKNTFTIWYHMVRKFEHVFKTKS